MNYNLVIVQPNGYLHSAAFLELADLIAYSLQDLGHGADINVNRVEPGSINIIFGCHLLEPPQMRELPLSTIVVNTEQLLHDSSTTTARVFQSAGRFETWDYSESNLRLLKERGACNPKLLQIGFHPKLVRIMKAAKQDIDVLFYGSMGERRWRIIEQLRQRGHQVHAVFNSYGKKRDDLIARSKLVLNVHHYESHIFEIVRVFYLMTNSKAVVCEIGTATSIDERHLPGISAARYDQLADRCTALLENEVLRIDLEGRALETMAGHPQLAFTRELLSS